MEYNQIKEPAMTRRDLLALTPAAVAATAMTTAATAAEPTEPFGYSFNTSTIRGQKLPIDEEAKLAGKAGYNGFEPWIGELQEYVKKGGNLKDLGKLIADSGMTVPSAIGFARWIVDDDLERQKGLDEAKRDMEMVLAIGGIRIAAPPSGATDKPITDLQRIADRYRKLAELGAKIGIIPEAEI